YPSGRPSEWATPSLRKPHQISARPGAGRRSTRTGLLIAPDVFSANGGTSRDAGIDPGGLEKEGPHCHGRKIGRAGIHRNANYAASIARARLLILRVSGRVGIRIFHDARIQ